MVSPTLFWLYDGLFLLTSLLQETESGSGLQGLIRGGGIYNCTICEKEIDRKREREKRRKKERVTLISDPREKHSFLTERTNF